MEEEDSAPIRFHRRLEHHTLASKRDVRYGAAKRGTGMESAQQKRRASKVYRAMENFIGCWVENEGCIQNTLVFIDLFQADPMGFFVAQTPCPASTRSSHEDKIIP